MDLDVEHEARRLYEEADADTCSPPGPLRLARKLGLEVRRFQGCAAGGDAALVRLHGRPIVFVRRKLSPERLDFAVAHELAEWHLARVGYREIDVEDVADAMAGALVAPRDAYRAALREHGATFAPLAADFRTTETCVALRLGEVTGRSLVLLGPRVRVRGDEFAWPPLDELRRVARAGGAPGVEARKLGDDSRRVILLAA